jgi:hypothetical protein
MFFRFLQRHHLYTRSIRHLVMSADCVRHGTEDFACKLPVDHCHARRIFIVMPDERSLTARLYPHGSIRERCSTPSGTNVGITLVKDIPKNFQKWKAGSSVPFQR